MKNLFPILLAMAMSSAQAQYARGEGSYQDSEPGLLAMTIIFGAISISQGFKKSKENGFIALAICSLLAVIFFTSPSVAMIIFAAMWVIAAIIWAITFIAKIYNKHY